MLGDGYGGRIVRPEALAVRPPEYRAHHQGGR